MEREPIPPQDQAPRPSIFGVVILVLVIVIGVLLLARSDCLARDGYSWFWIPPAGCVRVNE